MFRKESQMNQLEKDALIMRQIFEKVMEVLYDNDVMYTRENIARMAQILMALSVNMIGMSSNDVSGFRNSAQKMVNDMSTMLDTMDPQKRDKMLKAVDEQLSWFEKVYAKQKEDFEQEMSESSVTKDDSKMN